MADNERYSPDFPTGLPKVTPDDIQELKRQHRSFEDDFKELQKDYPELARDLVTGLEGVDPRYLEVKRAFAAGAIYTYILFKRATEARKWEQLKMQLEMPPITGDDVGDADPQPSV